jgi:hypothetical protein
MKIVFIVQGVPEYEDSWNSAVFEKEEDAILYCQEMEASDEYGNLYMYTQWEVK